MELTLTHKETALPARALLHVMALAREGDRREGILLRQGKGWFQVSGSGHEALAALVYALRPDDYLFPYYRDRAMALARGVTNYELALAYFAKQDSSSGGRQMPGHYSDRKRNIFSVATPTASQCLPACGAAWAFQLEKSDRIVLVSVGDAATRQGEFYEALAFALQEKLPIAFIIEDNRYGISTPTTKFFPYRLGALSENHLVKVDARDPFLLFEVAKSQFQRLRAGEGPVVLWCELDRLCSHTSSDDQRVYRPLQELEEEARRDPLILLANRLIQEGLLSEEEWQAEREAIALQVDEDYQMAQLAADPSPNTSLTHLFGPPSAPLPPPVSFTGETTMVAAVNQTLQKALEEHPKVILFGEDIEDPKGGVFGLTKGLSRLFPGRVVNAPLAEATIVGTAVGLAAAGWRPVFELQFIDFICPSLNQLMTQVSSLRWRTCGDWSCPITLIAPYGAYLPGGGLWHSESNEGMWAHIHGLHIAIPSTPEDAAALLWTAIHGNDPTLFLLPKHIFRKRSPVSTPVPPLPFGRAAIRRVGQDVTLVTWGNCIEIAEQAAEQMEREGVSVEILDLRTLVPCDYDAIAASVQKTGRLVVVHEDARTTGFGQAILAEMVSKPERFNLFLSPPQLVAREDVPIPFNPILEYGVLPDMDKVIEAIRVTLN